MGGEFAADRERETRSARNARSLQVDYMRQWDGFLLN
jgi:hypothetical protein